MQAHVLAGGARVAVAPYLYSIDQLPRHHVDTARLAQQLMQTALGGAAARLNLSDLPETSPILADPRFLLAVALVPAGAPLFRWQEDENGGPHRTRAVPRTMGSARRRRASPRSFRAANSNACCRTPTTPPAATPTSKCARTPSAPPFATSSTPSAPRPQELRAVIAGFGERRIDEYRIGFTRRGSNEVIYGVVWPLYGRENGEIGMEDEAVDLEGADGPVEEIVALLKKTGVSEVRRHAGPLRAGILRRLRRTALCRSAWRDRSRRDARGRRAGPAALSLTKHDPHVALAAG